MFAGILCGPLLDAGYLRLQLCTGILLQFFGLMMASFCTKYWHLLLSQGLCVGLGAGFLYLPSVVVVSQYFSSKLMLAMGIAATGSSAGKSSAIYSCLLKKIMQRLTISRDAQIAGIIYPILIRKLISQIGFSWTMRSLALIMLALNGACLAVMRLRTRPKSTKVTFNLSTFRDLPSAIFVLGKFTLLRLGYETFLTILPL
jgi:hypothetical protein